MMLIQLKLSYGYQLYAENKMSHSPSSKVKQDWENSLTKKTATCIALTDIRKENQAEFDTLVKSFLSNYNNNADLKKSWGGGLLGLKATHQKDAKEKALENETIKKAGL